MSEEIYRQLTPETEDLLSKFEKAETISEEAKLVPKIQVDVLVSKIAFLYEKIRNIIEYKEEHLLRKNAIKRILKRRLVRGRNGKAIAAPLIYELIRARYLENNTVLETKIGVVARLINKYIWLINSIFVKKEKRKTREIKNLLDWILGIAACEIEEVFASREKDQALVAFMCQVMNKSISWAGRLSEKEKSNQVYIAVQRALVKSDRELITYRLFQQLYPKWRKAHQDLIREVAANIDGIYEIIERQIEHPLGSRLIRIMKKYNAPFIILRDVIEKKPEKARQIFSEPKFLEEAIRKACNSEYKDTRIKLRRSSIRSIIYIFLTKMLLALIIEAPYDLYVAEELRYLPLAVNIIFHPLLLFLIALTIKVPKEENTARIIQSIKKIIYQEEEKEVLFKIKPVKRNLFFNILFNFIYLITFVVSFGILILILQKLEFNIVSGLVFLLFLCLVSFFGIRNRESARELIVSSEKESFFTAVADFFAIPILRAGRWISLNFSKINIFVFIFDFIIEAPFKAFIEIVEDFFAFIREKKEEITTK